MRFSRRFYISFLVMLAGLLLFAPAAGIAQTQPAAPAQQAAPQRFEATVRAADSVTIMAGQTAISLWGVERVGSQGATFDLKSRTALDNIIGQSKVTCEAKGRIGANVLAQCTNAQDQDLSLYMIQQGYVTVDRSAVYGTIFEDAYIQAENQARGSGLGVWGGGDDGGAKGSGFTISFGLVIVLVVVAAFGVFSFFVMRGFQKVVDAQAQSTELMTQERKLRDKERGIVAVMLASELKANKAKIEAYLVVYEEMLKSLMESDRAPRYKKAGDIIQKQPALVRSVFDRNTDKLDMLGGRLSSELVHFYARIKSAPDYVTLEPSTPIEEAISTLEKVLSSARRMNDLAGRLLEAFANSGIISEDFQE